MRCDLPYLAYANSHKCVPRPAHLSRKSNSRSPPVSRTVDISREDTASEKKIETGLRELHDRRFSGPGLDSPVVTPKEPIGHCQDHVFSVRPCRIQEKTDFWTPLNRYLLATVAHTGTAGWHVLGGVRQPANRRLRGWMVYLLCHRKRVSVCYRAPQAHHLLAASDHPHTRDRVSHISQPTLQAVSAIITYCPCEVSIGPNTY